MSDIGKVALWSTYLIPPIWLGVLLGVSFLATPAKFRAESLTLPVALDVGRQTFHLLNLIEWITALGIVAALILSHSGWKIGIGIGLLALVGLQTFWLLPVLDARVATIIGGGMPSSSYHHVLYGVIEGVKALALLILTLAGFQSLRASAGV